MIFFHVNHNNMRWSNRTLQIKQPGFCSELLCFWKKIDFRLQYFQIWFHDHTNKKCFFNLKCGLVFTFLIFVHVRQFYLKWILSWHYFKHRYLIFFLCLFFSFFYASFNAHKMSSSYFFKEIPSYGINTTNFGRLNELLEDTNGTKLYSNMMNIQRQI